MGWGGGINKKNLEHGNFSITRSKSSYFHDYLAWRSVSKCPLRVVSLLLRTAMLSIQCVQGKKKCALSDPSMATKPFTKMNMAWNLFQHLLSPQRAPERLIQVAEGNLNTLVTEMNELLSRVSGKALRLLKHTDLTKPVFSSLKKTAVLFWNLLSNFQLCSWDSGVMVG